MPWEHYRLLLRLESPLHVGFRKVGNLMQTRRYVPARTLWGALVASLTRSLCSPPLQRQHFEAFEKFVNDHLRIGYLWPTAPCHPKGLPEEVLLFPWDDPELFDYLFLDAYVSTSVDPLGAATEEGSLHQVEFIAPYTRGPVTVKCRRIPGGIPVYLMGDLWIRHPQVNKTAGPCSPPRDLVHTFQNLSLQLGGERTYGWGRVRVEISKEDGRQLSVSPSWAWKEEPDGIVVTPSNSNPVEAPAHLLATPSSEGLQGPIEPLTAYRFQHDGFHLVSPEIAYRPGARVEPGARFRIRPQDGLWEPVGSQVRPPGF